MKEIVTKEMVKKVTRTYVSDDGKEFFTECECKAYEASKEKNMMELKWNSLKQCKFSFDDCRELYMILLNSPEDLVTAIGYMKCKYNNLSIESQNDFSTFKFPSVVEFDVNPDGWYMYIVESEGAKRDRDSFVKFGDETKELYKEITD